MGASQVWNQLKNITADEIIAALKRDGWQPDTHHGAVLVYIKFGNPNRRVTIHYHPRKTYQPGLLKHLISEIGWTADDLIRLKLIK